MSRLAFVAVLVGFLAVGWADTIVMSSGREMQGAIVAEDPESVTIRLKSGQMVIPREYIREIRKGPSADQAGLPLWSDCLSIALESSWGRDTQQIPATVIDVGVLRYVPYLSYRSGDYEFNIYGDPDAPAGIEIGIYNELLKDPAAKQNCLRFMEQVIQQPAHRRLLRQLDLKEDLKELDGYSFEITPETSEDAYGGWWVSVYDTAALEAARASDEEMQAITVAWGDVEKARPSPRPKREAETPEERFAAARKRMMERGTDSDWFSSDLRLSRRSPSTFGNLDSSVDRSGSGSSGGGSGRVYVRGYTRKDGTYVRPHTRSRPR